MADLDDERLVEILTRLSTIQTDNLSVLLTAAGLDRKSDLVGVDLAGANLSYQDFALADLREADLTESNLSYADLSDADLSGATLSGSSLINTNLRNCNLERADLSNTLIVRADLHSANLSRANLSGALLINTNLDRADLSLVSTENLMIHGTDFSKARLDEATKAALRPSERQLPSRQFSAVASTARKPHSTVNIVGNLSSGKSTLAAAIARLWSERDQRVNFQILDSGEHPYWGTKSKIDIAAAHFGLEMESRSFTLVDFQEHPDNRKNMVIGLSQADGAILVVSALEGPVATTREHILLIREVGVPYIVVALNKCDAVDDPEVLDLSELEIRELLKKHDFPGDDVPVVRLSALGALKGEQRWEIRIDALMEALDKYVPLPARDVDKPFLMPIEDIFSISGRGTVVTGRIERGKVKVGDEVEIVGFRETRKTVVTGVEMFKKQLDEGLAGDNAGLLLGGIGKEELERGMVLAKPGSITPHTKFKAEVYLLTKEEGGRHTPIFKGYRPQFYFRTIDVPGLTELPAGTDMVMPGDNVALTIELITSVALEKGLRFAIREGGRTVGAGTISEIVK